MGFELQTVARAVTLLRCFRNKPKGLSLAELSRMTGLPKMTVYRLAATLENQGLLDQDQDTQRYRPGYGLLELVAPLLEEGSLKMVAQPYMEQLRNETRETVCLTVRVGWNQVTIQVLASPQPIRYVLPTGASAPLYTGAAGRVILACLPEAEVEEMIRATHLTPITPYSLTDRESLLAELALTRDIGYARSAGERLEGAAAVAAPIFGSNSMVEASLSIILPSSRATAEVLRGFGERVQRVAKQITLQLGLAGDH